jgi:hypothetical protein
MCECGVEILCQHFTTTLLELGGFVFTLFMLTALLFTCLPRLEFELDPHRSCIELSDAICMR